MFVVRKLASVAKCLETCFSIILYVARITLYTMTKFLLSYVWILLKHASRTCKSVLHRSLLAAQPKQRRALQLIRLMPDGKTLKLNTAATKEMMALNDGPIAVVSIGGQKTRSPCSKSSTGAGPLGVITAISHTWKNKTSTHGIGLWPPAVEVPGARHKLVRSC